MWCKRRSAHNSIRRHRASNATVGHRIDQHNQSTHQSAAASVRLSQRIALPRNDDDDNHGPCVKMDCQRTASKMTTTLAPGSKWWRRERTIRYVMLRYCTAWRQSICSTDPPPDDVINMCVTAHEIMTLLGYVECVPQSTYCLCSLFTALPHCWLLHQGNGYNASQFSRT